MPRLRQQPPGGIPALREYQSVIERQVFPTPDHFGNGISPISTVTPRLAQLLAFPFSFPFKENIRPYFPLRFEKKSTLFLMTQTINIKMTRNF